jgi:hypothetical protein
VLAFPRSPAMCRNRRFLSALIVAVCWLPVDAFSAEITAERSPHGVVVKIDGQLFAEYLVSSGGKPILWPIIGPTGKPITRDYPMRDHPGEAKDHVHHRSLWFTHGDVNGVNFWAEKVRSPGTIKHVKFLKIGGGKPAVVVAQDDWIASDGKKVCEDQRTLSFDTDGDARWIDFDISVKATNGPVTFGDTKEGSFGVRVAETIRVDAKKGGRLVNSRQQVDAAAWGQIASWVDYHGPLDGQTVGIAIFNHPSSFRYPTYWQVRTYGLFAANPFGISDFTGVKQAGGAHTIASGECMNLRYRVFLHRGDEKDGKVAEAFDAYAKVGK